MTKTKRLPRWMAKLNRKRDETRDIDEETRSVGWGCLELDVEMARSHGWSEKQIRRAHDVLQALARKEGAIARRRRPELYKDEDGITVYVGP